MSESRELFPVTFMGPKNEPQSISGSFNPNGSVAGTPLADIPEPTEEELAAMEFEAPIIDEIPDPPAGADPEMAGPVGKGRGAPAKS